MYLKITHLKLHAQITELNELTHWGRVTHICISKLTIIGSDNGLSPERRQAIIWSNAGILLIGRLGTNFSDILIEIQTFFFEENTFENVVCEMLFISSWPQCVNGCQALSGQQIRHSDSIQGIISHITTNYYQIGPLLLTCINFNPSMDK